MIIEKVLDVLFSVISKLMVFTIPEMPDEVMSYVDTTFDYMVGAVGIVANYTPFGYLLVLFGIVLAIDAAILVYHFVMWVIKKIPFLGMS